MCTTVQVPNFGTRQPVTWTVKPSTFGGWVVSRCVQCKIATPARMHTCAVCVCKYGALIRPVLGWDILVVWCACYECVRACMLVYIFPHVHGYLCACSYRLLLAYLRAFVRRIPNSACDVCVVVAPSHPAAYSNPLHPARVLAQAHHACMCYLDA